VTTRRDQPASRRAGSSAAKRGSRKSGPGGRRPPGPSQSALPGVGQASDAQPGKSTDDSWIAPLSDDGRLAAKAREQDPEVVARQICLRMLAGAPKTRAQLAAALQRRGIPDQTADAVLTRFADVKLIDDKLFAAAWVESRHYSRGLASRALGAELRQRGVEAADITEALEQLDPEQELETARALVERKLAATRGQPFPTRLRRLMGTLARRGYSQSLAYRVVREALEKEPRDQGPVDAAVGWDLADSAEPEPEDETAAW
jgi:regulatory protein